jgi:hypothetical protein
MWLNDTNQDTIQRQWHPHHIYNHSDPNIICGNNASPATRLAQLRDGSNITANFYNCFPWDRRIPEAIPQGYYCDPKNYEICNAENVKQCGLRCPYQRWYHQTGPMLAYLTLYPE